MTIRVAACQIDVSLGEVDRNLERIERAVADAAGQGARLVVLPEAAVTGYVFGSLDEALAVAQRASAVATDRLAALSAQHAVGLIVGTLEAEAREVFNTALIFAEDGRRYRYRKMHLPYLGVDRFATPGPDPAEVYDLAAWRNRCVPTGALGPSGEVVPANVMTKAPTAELRPNQKDQDSLPEYAVLDAILNGLVESERSVDEIADAGFARDVVSRTQNMLFTAEYKRRQAPPGVKTSSKSFGRDRRYPITNRFRDR